VAGLQLLETDVKGSLGGPVVHALVSNSLQCCIPFSTDRRGFCCGCLVLVLGLSRLCMQTVDLGCQPCTGKHFACWFHLCCGDRLTLLLQLSLCAAQLLLIVSADWFYFCLLLGCCLVCCMQLCLQISHLG
jgi:hypothetical protein